MLNWLYEAIAKIVLWLHSGLSFMGSNSGWSWGLSIVLLTVLMRLLLFPLFVRQIRMQRSMQVVQPQVKELQEKYKVLIARRPQDKQELQMQQNREMMALYKEHGANPLTGCLPLLLQLPVFFALFRTLDSLHPDAHGKFTAHYGISAAQAYSAGHAKVFGAPLAAAFNSSSTLLHQLDAHAGTVRVVAAVMIVLMGATTFWTQRQLIARTGASGGQVMAQQKMLLYVLPFTFAIFGFRFPVGVLLYWLTTNLWSMGQQHFVIAKMNAYAPAKPAAGAGGAGGTGASPARPGPPRPGAAPASGLVAGRGAGLRGWLERLTGAGQQSAGKAEPGPRPAAPPGNPAASGHATPPPPAARPGGGPRTPAQTPGGAAPGSRRPNSGRNRRNRRGRR